MQKVSGIVLAGGKSSRMGDNKALLKLGDKLIIEHVIDAIAPLCAEVIISGQPALYHFLNYRVVPDNYSETGPMAGLEAALKIAKYDKCMITTCDMPFLSTSYFADMLKFSENGEIVLAIDRQQLQPLTGIFPKKLHQTIESSIVAGKTKPIALFKKLGFSIYQNNDCPDWIFSNINTVANLQAAIEINKKMD